MRIHDPIRGSRRSPPSFGDDGRPRSRRDFSRPGDRYLAARRWTVIVGALRRVVHGTEARRYLEVGCGDGVGLVEVAGAGLGLSEIVGIDRLMNPALQATLLGHTVDVVCADALRLPFASASFDVVAQCMLLTSVTTTQSRSQVAREVVRVIRPGGCLVSLDLRYPALGRSERVTLGLWGLRRLFTGMDLVTTSTHAVLPPLARMLEGSERICDLLSAIPVLRTYRLAVFRRPA